MTSSSVAAPPRNLNPTPAAPDESDSRSSDRVAKYLRREVRAELRRIAFQLEFIRRLDPRGIEPELDRFRLTEVLDLMFPRVERLTHLSAAAAVHRSSGARRSMKLLKRRLRGDLCRTAEKAQLIRAIDPGFEEEVHQMRLAEALDVIADWHARGDLIFRDRQRDNRETASQ